MFAYGAHRGVWTLGNMNVNVKCVVVAAAVTCHRLRCMHVGHVIIVDGTSFHIWQVGSFRVLSNLLLETRPPSTMGDSSS